MPTPPAIRSWAFRLGVAAALAAALAFGFLPACRPEAVVATATTGPAVRTVVGTVLVSAEFTNELKSEIGGRVVSTHLRLGDPVRRGEVLVQLDTGDTDLEIERVTNDLAAARRRFELGSTLRTEVENAREAVAVAERAARAGATPESEVARLRRALAQSEQRLALDEVNLRLALDTLETALRARQREQAKKTITAPADGVVTAIAARVGDLIGANAPIATIMTLAQLVEARLPEEDYAAVKVGQQATVRFFTYGTDQFNATVTRILPAADPATQRYIAHLDVQLPAGRTLAPGLSGEASIVIDTREDAIIIPRRALVGDHVLVVRAGRIERRSVQAGYESLNQVEILSGVAAGESVVVDQPDRHRPGQRVRPVGAAAPTRTP